MMYEGEDVNIIDLLHVIETVERNGVKVIIPVKSSDVYNFNIKIGEQLAYFENVYFDVRDILNGFKIYREEQFQYSELTRDVNMHICLDNVYYPIDFAKLNISPIRFPVGLKFSLSDGLFPTPNREALIYSQKTKDVILNKIQKVADYFVNKYNDVISEVLDFDKIIKFYRDTDRFIELVPHVLFNVRHISEFSLLKINEPKMKDVQHLNLKDLVTFRIDDIFNEYQIAFEMRKGVLSAMTPNRYESKVNINRNVGNLYILSGSFSQLKKSYIRETKSLGTYNTLYFIRKIKEFKLFSNKNYYGNDTDNYYTILELFNVPKEHWRATIVEFQKIIESIISKWTNVDDIDVPKSFIDSIKIKNSRSEGRAKKTDGEIIVKKACEYEKQVHGKNCKFVICNWKLKEIPKMKSLIVYTHHDDSLYLDKLYEISKDRQCMEFITLSSKELSVLEGMNFHNVISYSKFMEGDTKPFKRLVTSYMINRLARKYSAIFSKYYQLQTVSKNLYHKVSRLDIYKNSNFRNLNTDLCKEMVEIAKLNKKFDYSIFHEYEELKGILERFEFIQTLLRVMYNSDDINDSLKLVLVDLLKYHKFKVNIVHYKGLKS